MRGRRQKSSVGDQAVGTHAVALKAIESNAKNFSYPKCGFVLPVEHSLLYAMINQPKVYPAQVISEQIMEEVFEPFIETNNDSVSYAQLSALLVHATQNFKPTNDTPSEVSQLLCKRVLKMVIRYAEQEELGREDEIKEVLEPVRLYFERAGDKLLVPLYAGLAGTVLTGNPIPYLIGFAAVVKGSEENSAQMNVINAEAARKSDVERASLLDEAEDDYM